MAMMYVVVPGEYDELHLIRNDFLRACRVDDIIPILFNAVSVEFFCDDWPVCLEIVKNDEKKYGFLKIDGSWLVPPIFDEAHEFIEGKTYVRKNDEAIPTGIMDLKGNITWVSMTENQWINETLWGQRKSPISEEPSEKLKTKKTPFGIKTRLDTVK